MNLTALKVGDSAVVSEVSGETPLDPVSRRLLELGFIAGTIVKAMHEAPLMGNPKSYLVRGTHVALRSDEAKRVQIDASTLNVTGLR